MGINGFVVSNLTNQLIKSPCNFIACFYNNNHCHCSLLKRYSHSSKVRWRQNFLQII